MGLFDFSKKKETKKKAPEKKQEFELGKEGVRFRAIIEILGSPKKYVEDTVNAFVDRIKENHDYHVLDVKVSKPTKVKKEGQEQDIKAIQTDLFSSFADVEIGVKKKVKLFDFCFEYMPASVEVVEPMHVAFPANEISGFLTDIQGTLHKIDFALKTASGANQVLAEKNQILTKNMVRLLRNNILLALKEKNKNLNEIAKNVGIPEDQLKPFVENMVSDKEVKFEKNKYALVK